MALEGNLSDFGLSEILQLIAVQKKSGMLCISTQDRSTILFFRNGYLISTRDRRRNIKDPFKNYLMRYGVLARNEIERLIDISIKSKLDFTDVMVSEKIFSEEEMKKLYRSHIQEAVHDVLTWAQCKYKFFPGQDIIEGIKSWGDHNIDGVLMESMRRIDEFPEMEKDFHDSRIVISLARGVEPEEELTGNEKVVVGLLTEAQTLAYIISHAKIPAFETYETLKHLKDKDLIRTFFEHTEDDLAEKTAKQTRGIPMQVVKRYIPLTVVLSVFLVSMFFSVRGPIKHLINRTNELDSPSTVNSLPRARIEERIRWSLEAYRAMNGAYPAELNNLTESGLLTEEIMQIIEEHSIRYHLTQNKNIYTLL